MRLIFSAFQLFLFRRLIFIIIFKERISLLSSHHGLRTPKRMKNFFISPLLPAPGAFSSQVDINAPKCGKGLSA